jgi:hypothetical protein
MNIIVMNPILSRKKDGRGQGPEITPIKIPRTKVPGIWQDFVSAFLIITYPSATVDTLKGVFWCLLLGAVIGAFIYGFFPQDLAVTLAGPGNPWSIPIAAAVGVPMYIRAETVIPISAALVGKGMGVGTVLALIIGGAGASIPEMIILGSMFKKKLIVAFAMNVFLVAIAAGYLVDLMVY